MIVAFLVKTIISRGFWKIVVDSHDLLILKPLVRWLAQHIKSDESQLTNEMQSLCRCHLWSSNAMRLRTYVFVIIGNDSGGTPYVLHKQQAHRKHKIWNKTLLSKQMKKLIARQNANFPMWKMER